eukprot:542796-Hanusia_phi.AAC.1
MFFNAVQEAIHILRLEQPAAFSLRHPAGIRKSQITFTSVLDSAGVDVRIQADIKSVGKLLSRWICSQLHKATQSLGKLNP